MGDEGKAPQLRADLNLGTVWGLPAWSAGPRPDAPDFYELVAAAGYEGVQGGDPQRAAAAGLACATFGVHRVAGALHDVASLWVDLGFELATLHVGTGYENDAEALDLLAEVLTVSDRTGLPLFVETHRATVTQDPWRTVGFISELPALRFNGDFSHWYTGGEMTYGDFEAKVAFLRPVLVRTRYLHGRIGDPGCMQIPLGDAPEPPSVAHFRRLWTEAAAGFLEGAGADDVLPFAPELLPPSIAYGQTVPDPAGGDPIEASDRWADGLRLVAIARSCWAVAAATAETPGPGSRP